MTGKIQTRLAVLGALAALVAVLIPAGLASGSHDDPVFTGDPPVDSVVLLTLGKQDNVTWTGDTTLTQNISTKKNDCLAVDFAEEPDLLGVVASGGDLGEVKDGLGVQGPSDGSGEPCGRVEDDEAISVSLGTFFGDDFVMTAVDVDLELKFEAVVIATYFHNGEEVAHDRFAPMEKADDGPDSKDGDNYRYFHQPLDPDSGEQIYFDEVKFSPESGAFSLEGGADLADNDDPEAFGQLDETSKSSQFEIVRVFDGDISCGESIDIDDVEDVGIVTLHSLNLDSEDPDWEAQCEDRKPYNDELNLDETELAFVPEFDGQGRYTLQVTLENQPITVDDDGQITSLEAKYNTSGDLTMTGEQNAIPVQACEGQPIDDPNADGYDLFWEQDDVSLLPDGESVCFYHSSVTPTDIDADGDQIGTEFWKFYFEDDPGLFM